MFVIDIIAILITLFVITPVVILLINWRFHCEDSDIQLPFSDFQKQAEAHPSSYQCDKWNTDYSTFKCKHYDYDYGDECCDDCKLDECHVEISIRFSFPDYLLYILWLRKLKSHLRNLKHSEKIKQYMEAIENQNNVSSEKE